MSSIPLPALALQPPQQQPNLIEQYARVAALKNMLQNAPLQNQILQQQAQLGQTQVQSAQQDLAARQALNTAYQGAFTKDENGNPTFDAQKLQQNLANGPAAYKTPEVMKGITDFQKSRIDLQDSVTGLQQKSADMIGSAASAIKAANYDPTLAHSLLDTLPQSPQLNQIRAQIDSPNFKQMVDSAIANSPAQQKMLNDQIVAKLRANTPQMQEMNSWLADPKNAGKTPADYQQYVSNMEAQKQISVETNPQVLAAKKSLAASEAAARQAVQDGDPQAAAQLLVNGDVAPSQLISSRRPEFAQKAFTAAQNLSGGKWNAQSAEANFQVAKSPANTAFFGSAKSLTDPGGTLDQLQAAANNIPQGQIPIFNSIADAEKAATGKGPIAKYASIALGVADDYAKVVGGGVGSDTSRLQALNLIKPNMSPEGRAGSVEGIRGTVNSQMTSRIGNNSVMQRMYGGTQATGGGNLPAGNGRVIDPATAKQFYQAAGGDPAKARQLATSNGWKVQ